MQQKDETINERNREITNKNNKLGKNKNNDNGCISCLSCNCWWCSKVLF